MRSATRDNRFSFTMIETLERRSLLSAATDATGFYPAVQVQGDTTLSLQPIESVLPNVPVRVAFGVPFPRGFVTDLSRIRVLSSPGGAERASAVQALTPWRDIATGTDEASVRAALVQLDVTFPDVNTDGRADPVPLTIEWGRQARATAGAPTPVPARDTWVQVNDANYAASDNVFEPRAYAVFTPQWYGDALIKHRLAPAGSDPDFATYDAAFTNFGKTMVNDVDPRVTEANRVDYRTDFEPWLYDRAMTLQQLGFRTGSLQFLREGHRAAQFYANHINTSGYFDMSNGDLKYVYGESISADYWLTGDARLPAIHQRMLPVFNGSGARYTVGSFWTERHAAYKLLGHVTSFELLGGTDQAQRARDTFAIYLDMQDNPVSGAPETGLLMHRGVDHAESGTDFIASPWMTTLLVDATQRYYAQGGDTRAVTFITRIADGLNAVGVGKPLYYADDGGQQRLVSVYLAGPQRTAADQNYADDREHAIDVAKPFALAAYFAGRDGNPATDPAVYRGRFDELSVTANGTFAFWTRPGGPASGLSVYRLSPHRKFNWWFRTTADHDWLVNNATTPPAVERAAVQSVTVNDGNIQRSKINSLTVAFDRQVFLDSGAFTLVGRSGAGAGTAVAWANPSGDGRRWVLSFSGTPVLGGSLADGIYDLTVLASRVHTGSASGATMAADYTFEFHRLFSDANGDGDSDNGDLVAMRETYGKTEADPEYDWFWDYMDDGDVDNGDVVQVRSRRSMTFKNY